MGTPSYIKCVFKLIVYLWSIYLKYADKGIFSLGVLLLHIYYVSKRLTDTIYSMVIVTVALMSEQHFNVVAVVELI